MNPGTAITRVREAAESGCVPNSRHRRPRVRAEQFHARLWPNNATILTQNRLALVGEESVSVGHRRQWSPGPTRKTHPCALRRYAASAATGCSAPKPATRRKSPAQRGFLEADVRDPVTTSTWLRPAACRSSHGPVARSTIQV